MPPYPADSPLLSSLPEHFCIIAPSAGKEANRWPADRFGELAARLPLPSVVISSKADAGVVEAVVAASKGMAIDMAGKTGLKELVALIARSRFLISNDTGPMHIAAALGVPVFAIFGPANPIRTGPYGTQAMDGPMSLGPRMDEERPQAMDGPVSLAPRMDKERPIHTIIQERLDCIPCYRQKPCQNWACMKNLSVEKVRQEIVKRGFISEQANLES
jgi:ADP-heptose:LPS heptosyltransferase